MVLVQKNRVENGKNNRCEIVHPAGPKIHVKLGDEKILGIDR